MLNMWTILERLRTSLSIRSSHQNRWMLGSIMVKIGVFCDWCFSRNHSKRYSFVHEGEFDTFCGACMPTIAVQTCQNISTSKFTQNTSWGINKCSHYKWRTSTVLQELYVGEVFYFPVRYRKYKFQGHMEKERIIKALPMCFQYQNQSNLSRYRAGSHHYLLERGQDGYIYGRTYALFTTVNNWTFRFTAHFL